MSFPTRKRISMTPGIMAAIRITVILPTADITAGRLCRSRLAGAVIMAAADFAAVAVGFGVAVDSGAAVGSIVKD
jgi:hypothetical protein